LTKIGKLGINADVSNGFDIGGVSATGYAILTVGTETKIYTVNLTNGSTSAIATFPKKVTAFALGLGF
jgi:hypothetical protein